MLMDISSLSDISTSKSPPLRFVKRSRIEGSFGAQTMEPSSGGVVSITSPWKGSECEAIEVDVESFLRFSFGILGKRPDHSMRSNCRVSTDEKEKSHGWKHYSSTRTVQ